MLDLNAVKTHLTRLEAWQRGDSPPPGPDRVTLFPTNICNIKCKHCWQRWADYDKTYKSEMPDERLLRLADEGAELGVKYWYFVGGGEPLARGKTVMAMAKKIRDYGGNGGFHTNGTLLRQSVNEQMVETGWQHVRVSLDGPTAEINDFIRSKGFDKAVNNLKALEALKKEHNTPFPEVLLYASITNMTYDKIDQFVDLAAEIGEGVGLDVSNLIIESEGSQQFEMTPEQKEAYPDFLRKGIERAKELGVTANLEAYLDTELSLDSYDMHRDYQQACKGGLSGAMCYEPWTSASILPDGKLGPCCAFWDEDAPSVKDLSFAEVWNSPYMTQVRAGMLDGNPPDFCKRCPSNLFVQKEARRVFYAPKLHKEWSWQQRNPAQRLAYLTGRSLASMREAGPKETLDRVRNWIKIRTSGKAHETKE